MLLELTVRRLGVIEESTLVFGAGLTALTGETGAGKTLLVDALAIVMGGRPPRGIVRAGEPAYVEAVFRRADGTDVILAREIPSEGRARAWVDGRLVSLAVLNEVATGLCDIHGQHEHQSLLSPGAVRSALDAVAGIDRAAMLAARAELRSIESARADLGGDPSAIERECALLDHQVGVIDAAHIADVGEIDRLLAEAALLSDAQQLRTALATGLDQLEGHEGSNPRDSIAQLRHQLISYPSLAQTTETLEAAEVALAEASSALRSSLEAIEANPQRSEEIDDRLRVLHDLCRMHGPALADVLAARTDLAERSGQLRSALDLQGELETTLAAAQVNLDQQLIILESARRTAAPTLLRALKDRLADLALGRSEVDLQIDGPGGEHVELLFSANRGHALQPVAAVASGGELARLMLALRLILPGGPTCMVFDEVDAGIGGSTALVLAGALNEVALDRQVLVVTHLAQVAAAANRQVAVIKTTGERDGASARELDGPGRISEIARMLSGHPDSEAARRHASELLALDQTDAHQLPLV